MATKTISSIYKKTSGVFLVPEYYKNFSCKGKDCRNTCCSGWQVLIPMKEYYKIHGLECKKSVRERIDKTFKPLASRTESRFAEIAFDFEGKCKMLTDEGYCFLHQSCGETVLPSVCRYFPRGPRIDYAWECSTSNSCEKTLELLYESNDPIRFEQRDLTFEMEIPANKPKDSDKEMYISVRENCIEILQDRSMSLPDRIVAIGHYLQKLDMNPKALPDRFLEGFAFRQDIVSSIKVARELGDWFIHNTGSLEEYFIIVDNLYDDLDISTIYKQSKTHFEAILPNHEILFEKTLVNNIFFRQFPFQDYTDNFKDEFIALCGKYLIMRYLTIGLMTKYKSKNDFIDIIARIFRTIAHTGFEKNVMIRLKQKGYHLVSTLGELIQL
ncbi:MAG: flagellin lysine-N-methylase [Bacilli bacterium]|nr:flagellin lysine-N-methylase [Bacilli bacterium]MBN2876193.1 flagellin lysine-N-methylase [Bacilli bacterium]